MGRQLGALSGLSILLILVNHSIEVSRSLYIEAGYPPLMGWQVYFLSFLQGLGILAVPTFLFISGSFVAYAAQGDPPHLSRKFLLSSLRHILIPYMIWSLVFYIFIYFYLDVQISILGYLKNLIVGYPFHFVPLLVFWYIVSPLLVRYGKTKYSVIFLCLVALLQLMLLNILRPGLLGFQFPGWMDSLAPSVLRTTLADWAIYFPMGLVFGLNAAKVLPWSRKLAWLFGGLTVVLLGVGLLAALKIIHAPLARYLCPVPFILMLPGIKRDSIPLARLLERVGRRTYGIYLTHLIMIYLVAEILLGLLPALARLPILLSL
ncbi:MAG: hypothetical protein A2W33_05670, partial [Chloroflexi bacterium RBG_16_52_11]